MKTIPMRPGESGGPALSYLLPISEVHDDPRPLIRRYLAEIHAIGGSFEFLIVVDGGQRWILPDLEPLALDEPGVVIVELARTFGEAAALTVGLQRARGETVVTLPSFSQVDPASIRTVLERLAQRDAEIVVGRRNPRIDSAFNRLVARVFHWAIRLLTGARFHDVSCGLRAMRADAARELDLYGDLHRFTPLLALSQGLRVVEQDVRQADSQPRVRYHPPGAYPRRLLDLLNVFFLVRFTRKPLRFFGMIGGLLFMPGLAIMLYLGVVRLLGMGAIGHRPLLLLGVLLMVLGFQTLSIGMLGEIIIFLHGRKLPVYTVRAVQRGDARREPEGGEASTGQS